MYNLKLYFLVGFIFASFFCAGQSQRFYYEFNYVTDSTKVDNLETELMHLDIFKDHSEFLSSQQALRDSSMFNVKQKSNEIGTNMKEGKVRMKIYKGSTKYSIENIGIEHLKIIHQNPIVWTLHNEHKTIGKYTCQKATTELNGRKWIAWFTSDLPIQGGPYVFDNLPGLILEIQDEEKLFTFLYKGNRTIKNSAPNITFTNRIPYPKVSREQFNKKWKIFRENPVGFREQWVIMNPTISNSKYYDANGNLLNTEKVYKEDREKVKRDIIHYNVFIDKHLYQ